jgi:predicted negative regulator of RcsB-dependent stress response
MPRWLKLAGLALVVVVLIGAVAVGWTYRARIGSSRWT